MTSFKTAAQVCEMLLLVAGIALLCSTEGFQSSRRKDGSPEGGNNPDDFSSWGIGA
jgi:hypothetical protein